MCCVCAHMHASVCVYIICAVRACVHMHVCNKSMNRRIHNRASMYPAICYVALKLTSSIKSKISINPSRDNFYDVISHSVISYTGVLSKIIHRNNHDGEV